MKQNDQQNYWQPQDEPETQVTSNASQADGDVAKPGTRVRADRTESRAEPLSSIEWEASEAIEGAKGPLWYIAFSLVVVSALAVTIYFREWIFAALIFVVAVAIVVMARRPARVVKYVLNASGLRIDQQLRNFSEFRAFGVVRDGKFFAIKLIPTKRFSPEVMVYFPESEGESIVDLLGSFLPMEEMKLDLVDRFIRKIRL